MRTRGDYLSCLESSGSEATRGQCEGSYMHGEGGINVRWHFEPNSKVEFRDAMRLKKELASTAGREKNHTRMKNSGQRWAARETKSGWVKLKTENGPPAGRLLVMKSKQQCRIKMI